MFGWKFSHFGEKSHKQGVQQENVTVLAKIPKIECLARTFLILSKIPRIGILPVYFIFLAKILKIGCLAGKFLTSGKHRENMVLSSKLSHVRQKLRKQSVWLKISHFCRNPEIGNLARNSFILGQIPKIGCITGKFLYFWHKFRKLDVRTEIFSFCTKSGKQDAQMKNFSFWKNIPKIRC